MRAILMRVEKCRACKSRPVFLHALCRECIKIFVSNEMKRFEKYIDNWYGRLGE